MAGRGARDEVLLLQHGELGFQQPVFAAELGDFRGGGEGALDALAVHLGLEAVEFLAAGFERLLERVVLRRQVALEAAHARLERRVHRLERVHGEQQVAAETGQHAGDDFERGQVVVDELVVVLPVGAAERGDARPEREQEVVAFGQLFLGLLLERRQAFALRLPARFEFADAHVLLRDGAEGVLVRFLPLLVLGFVGAAALALTLEEFGELLRLQSVAFQQGVSTSQCSFPFRESVLGHVDFGQSGIKLFLQLGDGLVTELT